MNETQHSNGVVSEAMKPTGAKSQDCGPARAEPSPSRMAMLTIGALGVVFGDIGTSPLYALRETVRATSSTIPDRLSVFAAASMIVWSLVLVVTVKYVVLIMRADNDGEGGVLALAALAHRSHIGRRWKTWIGFAAILGLSLFYGDGIITPAISVLSAVELAGADNPGIAPLVVPLTLLILFVLFAYQNRGTAKIGRLFGPVMALWFVVLAWMGLHAVIQTPEILWALNPYYAVSFFIAKPAVAFVSLGSVVLAVTGCEALYADMGHFGRKPIRLAWLVISLPALILVYFGQSATILRDPHSVQFVFFAGAPNWAHNPLVILSVIATVIASQAVISGVYSITQQAVQLGQLPRMEVRHTSATDFGQIYVPQMNLYLCIGVVLIVLIFRSSDALAAAYGIAVTGVMVISTMLAVVVAIKRWKWPLRLIIPVFGPLALIDLSFLAANSLKIREGGWLPLLIAAGVFLVMDTWRRGRRVHIEKVRSESMPLDLFLERADKTPVRVAGTAVFLSPRGDVVPGALLHNLKHNRVLHERVVLAHVVVENIPLVPQKRRLEVIKLGKGFFNVFIHYGFFDTPDVPTDLEAARAYGLALDPPNTTFFIGHETLVPSNPPVLGKWRTWLYMRLASAALSPARFYRLPPNRVVEMGTQVTI